MIKYLNSQKGDVLELVYLWVEDYKNIQKQGFNFSPRFRCEYDEKENKLTIDENDDYIPDFFGENINVTAIVGKNGSGKSSILALLEQIFLNLEIMSSFCLLMKIDNKLYQTSNISNIKFSKNNVLSNIDNYHFITYFAEMPYPYESRKKFYENNNITTVNMEHKHIQYLISQVFEKNIQLDVNFSFNPYKLCFSENHKNNLISIIYILIEDNYDYNYSFDSKIFKKDFFKIIKASIINEILHEEFNLGYEDYKDYKDSLYLTIGDVFDKNLDKAEEDKDNILIPEYTFEQYIDEHLNYSEFLEKFLSYIVLYYIADHADKIAISFYEVVSTDTIYGLYLLVKNSLIDNFIVSILDLILLELNQNLSIEYTEILYNIFSKESTIKKLNIFIYNNLCQQDIESYLQFKKISSSQEVLLSNINNEVRDIYFDDFYEFCEFEYKDKSEVSFNRLSHGEKFLFGQIINLYASILRNQHKKNFIFCLDEPELSLHPQWQKKYLNILLNTFPNIKNIKINFLITSHSPFLLSDIPKQNIIFLDKDEKGNCKVVDGLNEKKQTFGANIHTLLSDSFFMEDGLMGEFAKGKIDKAIKLLNQEHLNEDDLKYCEQIISIIGEPIVKNQLEKMLHNKKVDYLAKDTREEIELLKHRIDLLSKRI